MRSRRSRATYTKGDVNKLVDNLLHPFMRGEAKVPIMLLDTVIHALVEENPKESFLKFMKYTAPKLVDEITKQERSHRRNSPRKIARK
jgi:hypothetical protein